MAEEAEGDKAGGQEEQRQYGAVSPEGQGAEADQGLQKAGKLADVRCPVFATLRRGKQRSVENRMSDVRKTKRWQTVRADIGHMS